MRFNYKIILPLFIGLLVLSCSSDDDSIPDYTIIDLCEDISLHSNKIEIINAEIESIDDIFILQKSYVVTVEFKNTSNSVIFGDVNIVVNINDQQILFNGYETGCSQLGPGDYCLNSFQNIIDYNAEFDENPIMECVYFIEN